MSLRERLELATAVDTTPLPRHEETTILDRSGYQELKHRIHRRLIERADLAVMETMAPQQLRSEIAILVTRLLAEDGAAINQGEHQNIVKEIQDEVLGLGPLEPLLADPTISDILVNAHQNVYIERRGKLERVDIRFSSNDHLMRIIDKVVSGVGRRVDESSPMVDARLPDGSRVNVIIPPLAVDGPILSIRRFAVVPIKMDDLIRLRSITPEMAEFLAALVKARVNILISGGTGTGKTTLLNAISGFIPSSERIVTIEDAAELQMQQPHVVRLETRPPNIEGKGEVTPRSLVRNSLRMRPDRIIVGEVRGSEVFDMLQAMNTGHEGSMTTIHANTARDALIRLENMMGMTGLNLPPKVVRQQISSALSFIVQGARLADGKRKIVSIQEITGMEVDVVTTQEIFAFQQTGMQPDGTVKGHFRATGIRPRITDRLRAYGIELSDELFNPTRVYE